MTPLFTKLNLGPIRTIHVLNAPASFEPELLALDGVTVHRAVKGKVYFALAFVQTLSEVTQATAQVLRFRKVEFIKTMARHPEGAISQTGRAKAQGQRGA